MRAVVLAFLSCSGVVACGPDLGTCDQQAAETLVYLNGTPFMEGQAVIHQSCAGTFCHAKGATGLARSGAPHGLDFDVAPLTQGSTDADLQVLSDGVNRIRDEAEEIWSIVESGEMPPGDAGKRSELAWYADAAGTMRAMLGGANQSKLRNWLACAAPVVAATDDSPLADEVMQSQLGEVRPAGTAVIAPTFASIFSNLLTGCFDCHRAGSMFPTQALDFTSEATAYMSLFEKDAFSGAGAACSGSKLVIPNDCENSLLYQKLLPEDMATNECGAPMPYGGTPPSEAVRQAVCDWINAGAMR